jgi:hypothetical protein
MTTETDEKREAVIRAAFAYDQIKDENEALKRRLSEALTGLEHKNHVLAQAELRNAELQNLAESYKAERDDAMRYRSDLLATLHNVKALVNDLEIPYSPLRKRRNGKPGVVVGDGSGAGSGTAEQRLPDKDASAGDLPNVPSFLARPE